MLDCNCTGFQRHKMVLRTVVLMAGISLVSALAGCGSSNPPQQPAGGAQRYHMAGRVVSVEPSKQQVTVDAGDIPGFMSAMTMGYPVKNPNLLAPISPEDQITADVVVNGNDMYLENIVVVKKADQAKPPAAGNANSATAPPSK
jgi:Cu/Ag efflux protein CusF